MTNHRVGDLTFGLWQRLVVARILLHYGYLVVLAIPVMRSLLISMFPLLTTTITVQGHPMNMRACVGVIFGKSEINSRFTFWFTVSRTSTINRESNNQQ